MKKKLMRRNIFSQSFTVCKVEEKKMIENKFYKFIGRIGEK